MVFHTFVDGMVEHYPAIGCLGCVCVNTCVCMSVCVLRVDVCLWACACVCINGCVCISACVEGGTCQYVCMYVRTYMCQLLRV